MAGDPRAGGLVQLREGLYAKTFSPKLLMEASEKFNELGVLRSVDLVRRATLALHTLFLKAKMGLGILLQKIYEAVGEHDLPVGGARVFKHFLQLVDVEN
ncbi:MAG: hypothetical protein WCS94_25360, partial [Verrucomicrobiota bacterium]